ncbi:MAG: hypothetical protein CFE29_07565 [Bradyrhizobiaceae bacterium PARB1]|nr:MAG: hypothetical protein CFE29_07565 [Bradyrhizobiaceae bacterium PARB1]
MTQRRLALTLLLETGLRPITPRLRAVLHSTVSVTALLMFAAPALAQQLPTGGSVAAGSAAIVQPNASTLNINQGSDRAIINWQSFSVGTGGTVNFNQPGASSATLNRVTGATPSSIAGTINAPGTVLLVNPNGIAITRTGVVNTGSFAASTLNIKDSDFLAGNYKFGGNGGSAGVINNGRINVSDGGFVALLGGQVANNGVISARLGKVGLGAGEQATLDLAGDGFLSVAVPSSELGKLVKPNRALVSNKGRIEADGGVVYLSAATAQNVLRNAVNIPGTVRTNTVGSRGGRIVINGGAGGTVRVSGRLIANGKNGAHAGSVSVKGAKVDLSGVISASGAKGGAVAITATESLQASGKIDATSTADKGGSVDLTAANVTVVGALIDASGTAGGGTIQIGGGIQGSGPLTHALNVSIDSASTIRADALDNGHGGTIAVWSDGSTSAYGTFSARGGANGGNGGMIETSGAALSINGIRVDTSAAYGATGNWLLDPTDLTVDAAAAATISSNLGSNNVTLLTTANGASGPGNQSSGLGDININAAITWNSANTLTLTAYHAININAQISPGSNGKVVLNSGFDPTYTNLALINYSSTGNLTYGLSGGSTGRLTINGAAYTLVFTEGDIRGVSQSGNIAMARDISLNNNWGTYLGTFTGTFTGLGNQLNVGYNNYFASAIAASGTIRDIRLNAQTAYSYVQSSVFYTIWGNPRSSLAQTSAGTVANIYLTGTFNSETALIGTVTGGLITNVYVSGLLNNNQAAIASSMSNATLRNAYSLTGNGVMLGSVSNSTISNVYTNASGGLANSATNTTFTNAYYDTSTRGSTAPYGTGLTTAQLQGGLPSGFNGNIWAISTGTTYPYLRSAFNTAPQIVSGTGYSNTSGGVWQNTTVNLEIDTYSYFQASRTGNNGYYYFQLPTSQIQSSGSTVVTYITSGNFSDYYAAATLALNATGSVRNMSLLNDSIGVWTTATTLSDPRVSTDLSNALTAALTELRPNVYQTYYLQYGSLGYYTPSIQTRRILNAAGSFTVDSSNGAFSAITAADDLTLSTSFGNVQGYTPMIAAGRDIILNTGLSGGWMRAGRDVRIQTGFTTDGMTIYAGGDIAFNAAVNVSGMYLSAGDDILFNAAVTSTGTLQVNAADTISGSGAINAGGFWLQAGNYRQVGSLGAFSTADFRLSAGTTFLRVLGGDGSAGNAYQITDVYGLQGIGSALSLNYKLMNDISASATSTWYGGAGFVAIGNGQTSATAFTGSLNGQGHVIDGLTINRGGTNDIGLFGSNAGHIFDVGVANGRIAGANNVGALAGNNLEGGVIERSFGAAPVSGSTAGGLVGINTGTISQSFSTSSVTGGNRVGGLVGYNRTTATANGTIVDSYAQGSVSGNSQIGGFYGANDSLTPITSSYSTGRVTANSVFGGFGGVQAGAASVASYWNMETSGQATSASGTGDTGVTGLTSAMMQAALPVNFSTSVWGIVAGKSFPYLQWQFPGGTPQVVTGYAYKDSGVTLLNGGLINAMIDGVTLGRGVTYFNGLYIVLIPTGSILATGSNVAAYYTANSSLGLLNSASFAYQATGSVTMPDIWGGYLTIPAPGATVSSANPAISSAWTSVNAIGTGFVNGLTGARLGNSGNFTVDAAPDTTGGKVFITTSGANDIIVGSVSFTNSNLITLNSARDILVNGALSGSGNLSFIAANNVVFNAAVTGTNDVAFKAGGYITSNAAFSVDAFNLDGTWSQITSSMPAFSANTMTFTSGAFIRALGGDGSVANPYQLTDVYGLQGILSPQLMNKNFVLANNIDATVTSTWNGGAGFTPIGSGDQQASIEGNNIFIGSANRAVVDTTYSFRGTFDGRGYTINNITIAAPRHAVGIFGSNAGTISNVGVIGGSISGYDYVGGLVGFNFGTIYRSYTSGVTVSGGGGVGGLVGGNGTGGLVDQSFASSRVNGGSYVTGLVGLNFARMWWINCCSPPSNVFWSGRITNSFSMPGGGAGGYAGGYQGGVGDGQYNIALEGGLDAYATRYGTTGLPTGFSSTIWGIVPGYSYPYLLWQFPAGTTPQAITGQVITSPGGNAFGNVPISAVVNGAAVGNGFADGYGFYQLLLPQGTVGSGSSLLVYTPTLGAGGGATFQSISGSARNNNIYAGGYAQWTTASSSYTNAGYSAELTSAIGGNASIQSFVSALTGIAITSIASGPYVIGETLTAAGGVFVNASGVSVTAAITAGTDVFINSSSGISVAAAIKAGGTARLNASNSSDITINGTVVSGGALSLAGRNLTINAALVSTGTTTLTGINNVTATAAIISGGAASVTGATITLGPLYWANGLLTVTSTGTVNLNGVLSGAGPGAGATITGTSIAAGSTIQWQAGLMRLNATAGDVALAGDISGWGPGAALTISGRNITMQSASWQNGGANINASAGNVIAYGSLVGSGTGAGANITGRVVSIGGNVAFANAGVNIAASAGDLYVGGYVIGNGGGGISGTNITLGGLIWSNGTMTMSTAGAMTIYGNVDGMGGQWTINSGTIAVGGAVGVGTFQLNSGNWVQNDGNLGAFYAGNFNLGAGTQFTRFAGGDGSIATPYTVVDIYGLQGIATTPSLFNSRFVLGANIQAGVTANWNNGAGFIPIGSAGQAFTGSFNGLGYNINGLTINRPTWDNVGLFGYVNSGSSLLDGINLTNVSIVGNNNVGGLVGSVGAAVRNLTVTGNVTGKGSNVGGVAGNAFLGGGSNASGFFQVGFSGNVLSGTPLFRDNGDGSYSPIDGGGTGGVNVGGLVGVTTVSVSRSYSLGTVTSMGEAPAGTGGASRTGGLVGWLRPENTSVANNASVRDSMSAATVVALGRGLPQSQSDRDGNFVGGLVGMNGDNLRTVSGVRYPGGNISNSFATGNVTASGSPTGGLVGYNAGSITASWASGNVWVRGNGGDITNAASIGGAGGLVGYNIGNVSTSWATGTVTGGGYYTGYAGGLIGQHGARTTAETAFGFSNATLSDSYAHGAVTGNGPSGGLLGALNSLATFTRNYSIGRVTAGAGGGLIGSIAGNNNGASNLYNWYDQETSGFGYPAGYYPMGVGTPGAFYNITDAQARNPGSSTAWSMGSYTGFDFGGTWVNIGNNNYPVLRTTNSHTIFVLANSTTAQYGTAASLGYTLYGVRWYDDYSINNIQLELTNAGIQQARQLNGDGDSVIGGAVSKQSSDGTFYRFVFGGGTVAVTPRTITVQGGDLTRAYGDANPTGTSSVSVGGAGLVGGDAIGYANVSNGPGAANNTRNGGADADAGYSYSYTTSNAFFTSGSALNYNITYVNGSMAVTQRQVTVELIGSTSKTYDGTTGGANLTSANFRVSNLYPGTPDYNAITAAITGASAATYGSANAGTGIAITVTGVGITSNNPGLARNYVLASTTATGAIGTITPKALSGTVNLGGINKTYDGTTASGGGSTSISGSAYGFIGSDGSTLNALAGVYDNANAGSHTISGFSGLTLGNGNYSIGSLTITGTGSIARAAITVSAAGGSSSYGSSPTDPGLTATGLKNGETVAVLTGLSNSFGINGQTNAGSYTLSVLGALTNGNYTITNLGTGSWTVNPAEIVVTATGGSSIYGQSPANPGFTATGLQNGQGVGVLAGLANSFGVDNLTNAGIYTLSVLGTLTNGNYTITDRRTGSWTVSPAEIIVTATGGSSIYGQSPGNPGFTATGLQNGQGVGVLTGLANSFGVNNLTNAGDYTLSVQGALSNGNYTITDRRTGTWTVNPAEIIVTATGGSSIYGQSPSNPGFTANGLQNGQGVSVLTGLSNSFGINHLTDAGDHALSVQGGLTNGNYTITDRRTGTWTVNPAEITVTATGGLSIYGQSPGNPGFTATGLQNGQGVGVLTGLANSFGITNESDARAYTLSVVGTLGNGNYTITNRSTGTWTVNPAEITVTATGGSSIYGQSPANPGFIATGLQNGQTVGVLTGLSNSFGITNDSDARTYTLSVIGTLGNSNYTITNRSTGSWTVNPAEIVVTATGGSSIYGQSPANPGFTASGLQNGQTVSVLTGLSNSFGITNLSDANAYTLSVIGTLGNGNYTITDRRTGTWTVNPAEITVTANGGTSIYGGSPSDPGFSAAGLQNGQDVSVLTGLSNTFGIDRFSSAGNHTLSVAGDLTNRNYTITGRSTGIWVVTPAPLTVTATDQSKIYGDTHVFAGTEFSSAGLQNGESIGLVTLTSQGQAGTAGVAGGPYAITPGNARGGTFDIANYNVTYVNGGLYVTPASIVVGALGGTSVYGTSPLNPGLTATGLKNGENVSVLTGLSNSFGITNFSNAGNHTLGVAGLLTNPNYKVTGTTTATWAIAQAQLMYVATPAERYFGDTNPDFTGAVTGFVNGDTLASATGGKLQFTTDAKQNTIIGAYAIDGSGLMAANYFFVQAPSNSTALTISTPPTIPGSQFGPPNSNAGSSSGSINVSFQPAPAAATQPISVTTPPRVVASNTTRDIAPASLPDKNGTAGGRSYEPISVFDANQYSQFKLPDYAGQASEAAIFTMIGRFALPDQAATLMIDTFWNGKAPDLNGVSGKNPLDGKVTFSNSASIEAGKTNIAEMLKAGAVIIGGAPGQWLLATGLSPDGKSVLANDPVSGKVVAFTLDSATGAIGNFAGFYDAKLKGISPSADLANTAPVGVAIDTVKDFTPATFVTVKVQ